VEHVRLTGEANVRQPVLLYAFTGWNDAGEGASTAVRTLIEQWRATKVAEIDPEHFTDFATVRPFVLIEDGHRHIAWPAVEVWAASLPSTDVLLLVGPEPALRWRSFCAEVIGLAEHFGVSTAIALGALLAEYPHRRPTHLTATTSDDTLAERFGLRRPTYEGPTGIVGVLGDALGAAGVPVASLWAAVPTYVAQLPAAKATATLVRAACTMISTAPPESALAASLADYEARIESLLEDDKLAAYVRQLEQVMPMDEAEDAGDDVTAELDAEIDDDRLVAEVEQFLRDKDQG
jgi:proteasome assembly chaperone (PAC2) family protein